MIRKETNADLINSIVNKPEVRASYNLRIDSIKPLDFTEWTQRDDYLVISNGTDACSAFDLKGPAVYEGHTIFDVTVKRNLNESVAIAHEMIQWIWDNTHCQIITGGTPVENHRARIFNRKVGFTSQGIMPFQGIDGNWNAEWYFLARPAQNQ